MIPLEEIQDTFRNVYNRLSEQTIQANFDDDVDKEQAVVSNERRENE